MFRFCHIVIFYHDNLQVWTYLRIIIDQLLQAEDQMNNILCKNISRCCLCSKDHGNRCLRLLACLDFLIFMNNIKRIHLLSLVLMQSLDLDVKYRICCNINILCFFQIFFQICLLSVLDLNKTGEHLLIIPEFQQLFKLCSILLPSVSDQFRNICCKFRITVQQPAAECNTICLIIEFFRVNVIKRLQLGIL